MIIKFWGVHGSLPRPGPSTLKYGGNTACVEVRCGETLIIFDAGSGIRDLGDQLAGRHSAHKDSKIKGHIFFSHLHWDHIQGFPFFNPVFVESNEFHLYGGGNLHCSIHRLMNDQMAPPYFPVALEELRSTTTFHNLQPGEIVRIDGATIITESLNHPHGSYGYRLEYERKVVVYATDTEHDTSSENRTIDLARNADVLIYDAMFTPDQYLGTADGLSRRSWGHSTWEGAVEIASTAGVKQLILFHHGNDDDTVAEIERLAREQFPNCSAAYEGMVIEL